MADKYLPLKAKSYYLCHVFFIVLDLRLTRLGLSGAPFFVPNGTM